MAALDERGLASRTIVVVLADYGEEFDEHGLRNARAQPVQPGSAYSASGAPPHATGPRVVATPVSIVDIMPTLLDLVGVDGPGGMNGQSLAVVICGQADAPERPVLMESPRKKIG